MRDLLPIVQRTLTEFPCLTLNSKDLQWLEGYIKVTGHTFKIQLRTDCSLFLADDALKTLLGEHLDETKKRLAMAANAHAFLLELREIIERIANFPAGASSTPRIDSELPSREFYERLLREVASVGWERINLHKSLRSLDIVVSDDAGRAHSVAVALKPDYPASAPACTAALPEPFHVEWGTGASLDVIVTQFSRKLSDFQGLFRALDDIDANCYVLEPEHPSRADTFRRLALGRHCSVRLELDARAPVSAFPTCRFLGPDAAVAPLRDRLNGFMHLWNPDGGTLPRANLETVLGQALPPPKDSAGMDDDDIAVECGICYAYRLTDGGVPDVACDREACAKPYHRPCLVEWLRALPDTRQSFDTLMGACVYCEHPIAVSVNAP